MTSLTKGLVGATAGAGILGGLVVSASAAIVCSGHICWHRLAPGSCHHCPRVAAFALGATHCAARFWRAHRR
jgi:hypothetical protein